MNSQGLLRNMMTGIDKVILYGNKAKNAGIAVARPFNKVDMQKNEPKQMG